MVTPEDKMRKLFSEKLGEMLKDRNINQTELSKILEVSESTVGKWLLEKSMPRMGIIQKLSDYFKVGKSYFLEEEPLHKPKSNMEFINPQDEIIKNYKLDEYELAEYNKLMSVNSALLFAGKEVSEDDKTELETVLKEIFVKSLLKHRSKDDKNGKNK